MVESLGERDLANEYRRRFLAMEATRKKTKAKPKELLSLDEISLLHKSADELGRKALKLVQDTTDLFQPSRSNQLAVVQHALVLLLTYGTNKDWSNQRRACLSYQFKHAETDVRMDNFIECTDETVMLTVNTATKVRKTVRDRCSYSLQAVELKTCNNMIPIVTIQQGSSALDLNHQTNAAVFCIHMQCLLVRRSVVSKDPPLTHWVGRLRLAVAAAQALPRYKCSVVR